MDRKPGTLVKDPSQAAASLTWIKVNKNCTECCILYNIEIFINIRITIKLNLKMFDIYFISS